MEYDRDKNISSFWMSILGILLIGIVLSVLFGCAPTPLDKYDASVAEYNKTHEKVDWLKEFEEGETLAFSGKDIQFNRNNLTITFPDKYPLTCLHSVDIKDEFVKQCEDTYTGQVKEWNNDTKEYDKWIEGDGNRVYLTRLSAPNKDYIYVDIQVGQPGIKANVTGTWIVNGMATVREGLEFNYGESILHAREYAAGIYKDSPKPKFRERDLVVLKDPVEAGVLYQVMDKNYAKNGKNAYGQDINLPDGWHYHCMELIGPGHHKNWRHFTEVQLMQSVQHNQETPDPNGQKTILTNESSY